MASLNKVQLIGRLGKDPEIRQTQNGQVANLRLATSESWTDKASGERKEKTEWHAVTVYNENLIRVVERFLKKGSQLYVEGQLSTRKYTDNAGVEKYSTEIVLQRFRGEMVLLDGRSGGDDAGERSERSERPSGPPTRITSGRQDNGSGRPAAKPAPNYDLDDSIPF